MEYIRDINIQEAVINILDRNSAEPILNEFKLELTEEVYKYLYKHIERCLKDDILKTAKFKDNKNIIKEVVDDYLNGNDNDIISVAKELSIQLFSIMKRNENIPSSDLLVASMITDQGPMIAILKLDYVKSFTHQVEFINEKIGIELIQHQSSLPLGGQKIQSAAFIKPYREENKIDLYIIDKSKIISEDEYGANYWIEQFLDCYITYNDKDNTRQFLNVTEKWVRNNFQEDAARAEEIRTAVRNALEKESSINTNEILKNYLTDEENSNYRMFISPYCENEFSIDKIYTEKKLKRTRLKIDNDIDIYINKDAYKDKSRFDIQGNGDGSINMIIKHVFNYIEK